MVEELSVEEFLEKKRDFSPFLVHLTKDDDDNMMYAKDALDMILNQKTLKAFNHFCLFSTNLEKSRNISLQDKFKVVCFTETPIDQINVLLMKVSGRNFKPKPYGLVFQKEYIRSEGGNPVFYATTKIANPLWSLYDGENTCEETCKLLSLVNICQEGNDWHWEREWRIVGNLQFNLNNIYCGLCPEEDIAYFENKYPVIFLSPFWGLNKILDRLVER